MKVCKGFSLLEVIVVLVVIAVLAAIALPAYQDYTARPRVSESGPRSKKDHAVVKAYFASDRNYDPEQTPAEKFGEQRGFLRYGEAEVSIPRDHRLGELESPSIWKFEFRENPDKHVVLLAARVLSDADFYTSVSKTMANSVKKNALVFVHGYKTSFEDAAKRTAQMAYDLTFDGVPVFYSWPSQAKLASYTVDEQNIEWAEANIERFLEDFFDRSDAQNVFLIAHSMGNRGLTKAVASLLERRPRVRERLAEIILAAPDIDAGVFKRDIAPRLIAGGRPVTLYASSGDLALAASKKVHGFPRAGESGGELVVIRGLETIDASSVRTDFLGHSYFAESESIISDIFNIVKNGQRANERFRLEPVETEDGPYWKFRK